MLLAEQNWGLICFTDTMNPSSYVELKPDNYQPHPENIQKSLAMEGIKQTSLTLLF